MTWILQCVMALCVWCASVDAFAAVGDTTPQAWFVRPAAICAVNGDGLGYECATTAGGRGAFSGFSNILYSPTTGVDDGDTLYVTEAPYVQWQKTIAAITGAAGAANSLGNQIGRSLRLRFLRQHAD